MNPTDEARLDWDEDGPDEDDVLADNERLDAENKRLRAVVARVRVYLAEDHVDRGRAVTFAEGMARASLVVALQELDPAS